MTTAIGFFALMFIGVPIAIVLGLTTLIYVLSTGNLSILQSMPSKLFNGLQNFGLVAIPMFILLGEFMNQGGITIRLLDFAKVIFGHFRGGLAYVNIVANMFLATIIGSSTAQTAVMSKTVVPVMEKEGYSRDFASALTASASVVAPLIPPSMPFIIYGVTAGVSIGSLFLAGILPGIIFGLGFGLYIYTIAKKRNFPRSDRSNWSQVLKGTLYVLPALSIPVLIMVGITTGIFTATESAAVAVLTALLVGGFVYRELKWSHLPGILLRTIITTSSVTFLLAMSDIFGWVLNFNQIPQLIADAFLAIAENQFVFLLLVNLLLLLIGTVLEGVPALILLTPILVPIAVTYGVDPIHLGVIMVINLTLGLISPPVGSVLFVTSAVANVKIEQLTRSLIPFLIISCIVLLLVTYVPWTTLGLQKLLGP
ncbi:MULTISPECIES: TRAP transporter large permease [unclassified Paenibacillus]|uniref:TRAP transporter large permease n=1 Tax=unclassified Paenibacillus TaxID=185978 RepID=UPI001AE1BDFD|nr:MULTISPECIES: TRAP transporter large permease [unclassified Paenibacillus]MBP1157269.1 tripartite ATP-independent transporter DctM subunit [Paenibacillus sp. PvP091]MBP1171992.1 tripartite ATP-independent transporter DctM subunit [Paenibacillus sp. PvR098]MBP2438373.1 tripartite ATP-independent transporter DctM subunit [Paenibacillus sp. PvP052]